MIDQHAAQERINYEYFRDKVGRVAQEVQELLVPYRIDLSLTEFLRVEEQLEELKKVRAIFRTIRPSIFYRPLASNMVPERTRNRNYR